MGHGQPAVAVGLYVGIWRTSPDGSCKLPCPSGWKERPKAWQEEYVWVCQIGEPACGEDR